MQGGFAKTYLSLFYIKINIVNIIFYIFKYDIAFFTFAFTCTRNKKNIDMQTCAIQQMAS